MRKRDERHHSWFTLVKHALGSFGEADGYDKRYENEIAWIRIFVVGSNLVCAYMFMGSILYRSFVG
jgi:uncharacterized membrane protein